MNVAFDDDDLDRLETDPNFTNSLSGGIVKSFRMKMQAIRAAKSEIDLGNMRSLRFEKLKGRRQGQCSIRLNEQFRLIMKIEGSGADKIVRILGVEDYHR